jgi:hypothetical protein
MAFTPITLQIEEILQTDFVPDGFTKSNANFQELQTNHEELINDLEIDVANKKIGTDNPISLIKTENAVIKGGSLLIQTAAGAQIGSLTINVSNETVLNVDHLVIDSDLTIADITASGSTSLVDLAVSGPAAFTGKVTVTPSPAFTPQTVQVNLTYNTSTNYSEGTITLTNTSRKFTFLELVADSATYNSGSFNPLINGIKLTVELHASVPPADGTELCLAFYRLLTGSTDITSAWAALNNDIELIPESTLAIQDNAAGTLSAAIKFQNVSFKSNITFAKFTFGSQPRLIIVAEKNMA